MMSFDVGLSPDPPNPFNHRSTMIKTLEYMAAGVPIVAHDLVETRRICAEAAVYAAAPTSLALGRRGRDGDRRRRDFSDDARRSGAT